MMDREQFFKTFRASVGANRSDFARKLAADWLSVWPGDGETQLALAEIEIEEKRFGTSIERLTQLVTRDPEHARATAKLADAYDASGDLLKASIYRAIAAALDGRVPTVGHSPSWSQSLYQALSALSAGSADSAAMHIRGVMGADLDSPLPTLIGVKAYLGLEDRKAAMGLARDGASRWPETVAFRLWLADDLMNAGEVDRAVEYLHRAASDDPTGCIAERYLGSSHPYRNLWPAQLSIAPKQPIPAEVATLLGGNQLAGAHAAAPTPQQKVPGDMVAPQPAQSAAEPSDTPAPDAAQVQPSQADPPGNGGQHESASSDMLNAQPGEAFQGPNPGEEPAQDPSSSPAGSSDQPLREVAARVQARPIQPDEDRRVPTYLVVSSRSRLMQVFGVDTFKRIDEAIDHLVKAVRPRPGWTAYKVYVDDPNSLRPFGLTPVDPGNAWDIKLRLSDIDRSLAGHGQMIGAVLIVGGHGILPFHLLPNPTDDDDDQVPSDNPYATKDENYFAPEWPVGRIPVDAEPDLIVKQLRLAAEQHSGALRQMGPMMRLRQWLILKLGRWLGRGPRSLGYSASIWRKASIAVFRSIGEPGAMITSPPIDAPSLPAVAMRPTMLSYYNLHGLADAPEWFGQRDPLRDTKATQEYPVALRPQDVVNSGRAPKIVFTEACYGAHVIEKGTETAISLKFLASGSHAVVGSTKISYGSVTPPLIAADLLGRRFYENLNRGLPTGEALRQAKLELAAEMHRRQGYLDGEDQKTLISFVLYGDPLYTSKQVVPMPGRKSVIRRKSRPKLMQTSCALGGPAMTESDLDEESRQRVKSIVSRYLPGMSGATCSIHPQHAGCDSDDHQCPSHQLGIKAIPASPNRETVVVTLSKHYAADSRHHPHFARLTLDKSGKVLKLAVSR